VEGSGGGPETPLPEGCVRLRREGGGGGQYSFTRGQKTYELTNHLGNIMAVVTDTKVAVSMDNASVSYYLAHVISATDYYAYGSPVPGRSFNLTAYRYGFNGMELDNEISGGGANYYTQWRPYDPRIGRWWSVDRLAEKFPWWTPYQFAGNIPTRFVDIDGLEPAEPGSVPNQSETAPVKGSDSGTEYVWNWDPDEKVWHQGMPTTKVEADYTIPRTKSEAVDRELRRYEFIAVHIMSRKGPERLDDKISKFTQDNVNNVARALYRNEAIKGFSPLVSNYAANVDDTNIPAKYIEEALESLVEISEMSMRHGLEYIENDTWGRDGIEPLYIEDAIGGIAVAKQGVRALILYAARSATKTKSIKRISDGVYTFTKTAAKHTDRPYLNSPNTISTIIKSGKGTKDLNYKGGTNYRVPGNVNGRDGIWELGIDHDSNTIYHFLFRPIK
jgi:RHS repeat-associated protein